MFVAFVTLIEWLSTLNNCIYQYSFDDCNSLYLDSNMDWNNSLNNDFCLSLKNNSINNNSDAYHLCNMFYNVPLLHTKKQYNWFNKNIDTCDWEYVKCNSDKRVTKIDMSETKLCGIFNDSSESWPQYIEKINLFGMSMHIVYGFAILYLDILDTYI